MRNQYAILFLYIAINFSMVARVKRVAANRKLYRLMNDSGVIYQDND